MRITNPPAGHDELSGVSTSDHHTKYSDADAVSAVVEDAAYGAGWNADTAHAPSQNALYDKIEDLHVEVFYGEFSKNTADATGTETVVSGLDFTVRAIIFFAGVHDVVGRASWGLATSTDQGALVDATAAVAGKYYNPQSITGNQAIAWDQGSANHYEGTVSTFGTDGFTITWTKTNSPSGTGNVMYMAIG